MKFNDKSVLNSWLLSLLWMDSFKTLAKEFLMIFSCYPKNIM